MDSDIQKDVTWKRKKSFVNWPNFVVNEGGEQRVHVPWLNRFELLVVVEDVYSCELERQRRGYNKLLLWKARFPQLPAGIECTMGLLRVHLINQDVRHQVEKGEKCIYAEHDLQLMFASALTRCINQLTFVSQGDSKEFQSLVNNLNIPRWIVNLRHEASHRTVLPSYSKLVLGVQFLLEWLYTNYWKETNSFPGWIVSKSDESLVKRAQFKIMFDVWQAIRVFQVSGYNDLSECDQSGAIQKAIKQELKMSVKNNSSISMLARTLTKNLVKMLASHFDSTRCCNFQSLYSILLESDTFIPGEEVLNLSISLQKGKNDVDSIEGEDYHTAIVKWMWNFWSYILQSLQNKYALFPGLIHRLLLLLSSEKSSYRQLIIALWIKVICVSMDMSTKNITLVCFPTSTRTQTEILDEEKIWKYEKVAYLRQGGFICDPQDPESNYCSREILMYALSNPTKYTCLFLPDLLNITKPLVPSATKQQLEELVSLYSGKNVCERHFPVNHHIYTVEELTGQEKKYPENAELDMFFWQRASTQEWATCPVGVLPWQKGSLATLDFPSHVTWESKGEGHYDHSEFNDFNFRKDFDDNEMHLIQESVSWPQEKRLKGKNKIPRW